MLQFPAGTSVDHAARHGPGVQTRHRFGAAMLALPRQVSAPELAVGHARFSTHITRNLETISNRLPLQKYFQPASVTRDVRILERGHWEFTLYVAEDALVKAVRKSESSNKDRKDGARRKSPVHPDVCRPKHLDRMRQNRSQPLIIPEDAQFLWTEKEFLDFWQNVAAFVRDGKAGWAVRMVMELHTNDAFAGTSSSEMRMMEVKVKVSTWGEVIGHVWLALWVLSDKLTANVPMDWRAGDGDVIVRMSGTKEKTIRTRSWVRKDEAGENGSWGLASGP